MTPRKGAKKAPKVEEPPSIVRTFRVRIVKPFKGDWDDLGEVLTGLRFPIHRVMNKAISQLEVENHQPVDGERVNPRSRAYQLARMYWKEEQERSKEREEKRKEKAKKKKGKKKIEAESTRSSIDALIASTDPSSAVLLGTAGAFFPRWAKYKKEAFQGTMSLPSFRGNQPIYVASSSKSVELKQDANGNLLLVLSLLARGNGGKHTLVVNPCGPRDHQAVRRILSGEATSGDCKLVRNKDTKKWEAILSIKSPKPPIAEDGRVMSVHHGVRHLLTYAISKSENRTPEAGVLEEGADIVVHRKKYEARRRSLGRHFKSLGKGAKGRGKKRREQHLTKLKDSEKRWTRSRCQEAAAHLLKLAQRRGVTLLYVPDWTSAGEDWKSLPEHMEKIIRAFPLAAVREYVIQGAERRGIAVKVLPPAHDSRTCPQCGAVNAESSGSPMFTCEACLFERDVDVVAAVNMLQREGHEISLLEMQKASKESAKKLKP